MLLIVAHSTYTKTPDVKNIIQLQSEEHKYLELMISLLLFIYLFYYYNFLKVRLDKI